MLVKGVPGSFTIGTLSSMLTLDLCNFSMFEVPVVPIPGGQVYTVYYQYIPPEYIVIVIVD